MQKNPLLVKSSKAGFSTTDTVSRLLGYGVSCEMLADNSGNVTATVGKIFREISQIDTNRLARLTVRAMKAAAASMYLAAQAAGGTEMKSKELLDDALGMAVKYIKLPYSLPDAEEDGIKTGAGEWESCGITNDELFEF